MKFTQWFVAALACVAFAAPAGAAMVRVSVDTTPLMGLAGYAAFDFLAGAPSTGNSAVVSAFASDSTLGASQLSGDISGSLMPGQLLLGGGLQFFSEWLQGVSTFGNVMTFELDFGLNAFAGGRPDQFSFFLLDASLAPFATDDPSGASALFYFDLTGISTSPTIFSSAFAMATIERIVVNVVPEPATPLLALMALSVALVCSGTQRSRGRRARG